jgi:flagellar biosynthesis/type III secretory pathway chaperone
MTAPETDLLAQLIQSKLDCLSQLRRMGDKQLELVKADRITELLDLLAAKQRLLAELRRIERGLDPFRDQDPDDSQRQLMRRRDEVAARLHGANLASQARGAYTAASPPEGSQIDLLSEH